MFPGTPFGRMVLDRDEFGAEGRRLSIGGRRAGTASRMSLRLFLARQRLGERLAAGLREVRLEEDGGYLGKSLSRKFAFHR